MLAGVVREGSTGRERGISESILSPRQPRANTTGSMLLASSAGSWQGGRGTGWQNPWGKATDHEGTSNPGGAQSPSSPLQKKIKPTLRKMQPGEHGVGRGGLHTGWRGEGGGGRGEGAFLLYSYISI